MMNSMAMELGFSHFNTELLDQDQLLHCAPQARIEKTRL